MGVTCSKTSVELPSSAVQESKKPVIEVADKPGFLEPVPSPIRRKRRSVEVEIPPETPTEAVTNFVLVAAPVTKRESKTNVAQAVCWWFTVAYGTFVLWSFLQAS